MKLPLVLRASTGHVRNRLFRDLVLLVLVTVGLLAAVNWLLVGEVKRELAAMRLAEATTLVRDEVRNLLGPVDRNLRIARDGIRAAGLTPASDPSSLRARLLPALRHIDQIAGVIYADSTGAEYFLRAEGEGWMERLRPPGDAATASWVGADQPGASEAAPGGGAKGYDPRERPWFRAAADAPLDAVSWSGPYVFRTLRVPGVTAATAWEGDGGLAVLAMDVTLGRILKGIDTLPLGPGGRAFLMSASGGVYVPGGGADHDPGDDGGRFFAAHEHLDGPLPFEAVAAWRETGRPAGELVRFESEGRAWWGGFLPLSDAANAAWVGVALPVAETLGVLRRRWETLLLPALVILALGVGLATAVMRRYSRQLRDLPRLAVDRDRPEQDLQDLIAGGEGAHLEFKSTMRTNLHTGKPGKEIELAWLKAVTAFLNTEGGILLLGVSDDGTPLGLEPDGFENEDKCRLHFKNLLNQHLGPENARFVRLQLLPLAGKQVAAVECERADAPVFLRNKGSELFLIRNGPSNIELPISRALKYIRGRF